MCFEEVATQILHGFVVSEGRFVDKSCALMNGKGNIRPCVVGNEVEFADGGTVVKFRRVGWIMGSVPQKVGRIQIRWFVQALG